MCAFQVCTLLSIGVSQPRTCSWPLKEVLAGGMLSCTQRWWNTCCAVARRAGSTVSILRMRSAQSRDTWLQEATPRSA